MRADILESVGAYSKCLMKHELGSCNKRDYPYCGGPHNPLLCYKRESNEMARMGQYNQFNQHQFNQNRFYQDRFNQNRFSQDNL